VFERFTDSARDAVVRAQEEARALGHNYLGTEHLLLGVLGAPGEPAVEGLAVTASDVRRDLLRIIGPGRRLDARALADIGIDLDEVRRRVDAAFGPGALDAARPGCASGMLSFTPRAKKVLELAVREARALGRGEIAPEHIVLGILREGEGVAAQILAPRGVTYAGVRRALADDLRDAG
jgi:ATP-dependent Clp protease ATP-binding subunit ClpA